MDSLPAYLDLDWIGLDLIGFNCLLDLDCLLDCWSPGLMCLPQHIKSSSTTACYCALAEKAPQSGLSMTTVSSLVPTCELCGHVSLSSAQTARMLGCWLISENPMQIRCEPQEDGSAWLWGSQVNYQLAKGDTEEVSVSAHRYYEVL
eukprot:1142692-Pelagomonas_calceolata.AAC.3